MKNACSMLSILVYDGAQPRNVIELENCFEKAVMDINLSCFDQMVKLYAGRIARNIEKKGNTIPQ